MNWGPCGKLNGRSHCKTCSPLMPESRNVTLFGKRGSAHIIKVKDLKMKTWIIWVNLKTNNKSYYEGQTEEKNMKQKAQRSEGSSHRSKTADSHPKVEETRKGLSPRASAGSQAPLTPWC